jgi:RHS repeat-associated protein
MMQMKYFTQLLLITLTFFFNSSLLAEVVYIHNDALGSPIMKTNQQGTVISRSHYKPFGETLDSAKDDVGYTGHLNDTDLGLTYMQARYYDPVIGRFYSNDPIGFRDIHSFNRYTYANNNPYKYTDPTGMSSVKGSCGNRPGKCLNGGDDQDNKEGGSVERDYDAELGKVKTSEDGVITEVEFVCGMTCRAQSGLYSYQHSMDLIRLRNQNDYGGLAGQALFKIGEYGSYGFIGAEVLAASMAKWAFMKSSDKIAYFMIVGDGVTLGTGGAGAVISDTIYLGLYQNARTLIPRMTLKSTIGKPFVRNGKFVVD